MLITLVSYFKANIEEKMSFYRIFSKCFYIASLSLTRGTLINLKKKKINFYSIQF